MSADIPGAGGTSADFQWEMQGRVIVVDHGANLATSELFTRLMPMGSFSVVAFDPASRLDEAHRNEWHGDDEFQHIAHVLLGNGEQATLKACIDQSMSGTLEPLDAAELPEDKRDGATVLTRLPVPSLRLDTIDDLKTVDWLVLDDCNNNLALLENGVEKLATTLLVHARVPFLPTHQQQANLTAISQWMAAHGFQCYCFNQVSYQSGFTTDQTLEKTQASQLKSADAVFIPDERHLQTLAPERLLKLAFLMDTVHNIHDLSWRLLQQVDEVQAHRYLAARGYLNLFDSAPDSFELTAEYCPAPWQLAPDVAFKSGLDAGAGSQVAATSQGAEHE